jgi:hypothetical protein
MAINYFVALPFVLADDGTIVAGGPIECVMPRVCGSIARSRRHSASSRLRICVASLHQGPPASGVLRGAVAATRPGVRAGVIGKHPMRLC